MIKAFVGRKAYYIFPKEMTKNEALTEVALTLHEKSEKFEVDEAKQLDETHYEIGSKGRFWVVTRKEKTV